MEPAPPEEPEAPEPTRERSFLSELPGLLLAALVVAVLIKTFVVQPFYIPSGSMIPTLEIDDRVMVSKVNYHFSEPGRGDVVVFLNPYAVDEDQSWPKDALDAVLQALGIRTSVNDDLIKRVIATGGEEIEIHDNTVFVDGNALSEPYIAPGSVMPDQPPRIVPEGHIFVMGDNRGSSSDSRVFGPVPVDDVVGKAVLRIWPLDRLGTL
jgi:signal peptidase I